MRIDCHHHLWVYSPSEYGWINNFMQPLRRDFLPPDLAGATFEARIDATVAVQARQTVDETLWLLELAGQGDLIRGVVGWAPIAEERFHETLDVLQWNPLLKGLRHVAQAEPDGFLDSFEFNRGIAALEGTGLVYDLLIYARQLPEATRLVDRHPRQAFVLDHIAKPLIAAANPSDFKAWRADMEELARRPNVTCKLSGMVTEANWSLWSAQTLYPYFGTVLEAFGPSRMMMGSDWPVLTVACEYRRWFEIVDAWIAPLSADERAQIEGGVANEVYHLGL
jgi:L-fuconolactonase